MTDDADELPYNVKSIYWAIIDQHGGKDAFSEHQLQVALILAHLLCKEEDRRSYTDRWQADHLYDLLPAKKDEHKRDDDKT